MVGYGQVARLHTEILAREGHRLECLVGRLPDRSAAFALEHGFVHHSTDLARALEDPAVDAVVLCTPNALHAAQASAALEAGKHVLAEIPLAMSYDEGRGLAELARRTGRTLMVAHTHRFHAAMRWVHERVVDGEMSFENVVARYMLLRRENVGSSGYVRSWTDNLLWHHGQHATDIALWLLGIDDPGQVDVTAMFAEPDPRSGAVLDLSLLLRTRHQQIATVAMSYSSEVTQIYDFILTGRAATLVIENGMLRTRERVLYNPATDPTDAADSRLLQDREFAAAVREGRPPAVSADSVLPALEVMQKAQDAAAVDLGPAPAGSPRVAPG